MTRPAVFLDRDGTLVEEVPYLHDPERLALLPGVGELAALAAAGYALVVVTNQAGVARGRLYDEAAVAAVVDAVLAGAVPAGREEARPAPAVTERVWPGMPVGRERARP